MNLAAFEPALKTAITNAVPDGPDAIYNAVVTIWKQAVPTLIAEAVNATETQDVMIKELAIPLILTIEDTIHDLTDDPQTDPIHIPGLRHASRIVREMRRQATTATEDTP